MYRQGCSQKQIAEAIGKDKSVVSREIKRNANPKGKYSFEYAQDMACLRKERMKKPRKLHAWLRTDRAGLVSTANRRQAETRKQSLRQATKPSIKSFGRTRLRAEHFTSIPEPAQAS